MKDVNYILDNFPMDKFINIGDDNNIKHSKDSNNRRSYSQGSNKIYKIN